MRSLVFLILFFICGMLQAQTYEIGVFGGGANVIGDVGRTNYILPSDYAFGGIFKWNKSKRYAWRASLVYGQFTADDSESNIVARQQRGYVIDNSVLEASAGLEFNFVEYNLHKLGHSFTPYLYSGITYFRYDYDFFDAGTLQTLDQTDGTFALPVTVGFKYRMNQFFIIGAEIGVRYTFTDNLDGSNPVKSNVTQQINPGFGNLSNNDWYTFSGVTFTYTFGRKLCTDCFE